VAIPADRNYKKHFQTNFGPEILNNESTQCTGHPLSAVSKQNLNAQTRE